MVLGIQFVFLRWLSDVVRHVYRRMNCVPHTVCIHGISVSLFLYLCTDVMSYLRHDVAGRYSVIHSLYFCGRGDGF